MTATTTTSRSNAAPSRRDPVPQPTLSRLPWYLAYVNRLRDSDTTHVSSTQISRYTNVEASQIAKDLSYLGIRGKTRIGYEVKALADSLSRFLGFSDCHNAVMVGVGSLGAALMADSGLQRFGLRIVAGIDTNPALTGTSPGGVTVYLPSDMHRVVSESRAEIGIIAVPVEHAQQMADDLVEAGIRALWNFTPCRITARDGVVVQDTSIYAHLAVMYHRLTLSEGVKNDLSYR